jgi:hypothetical protein
MSVVIVVAVFVAFVGVVALLTWRAPKRVQVKTCCSARPWPPTDLVGGEPSPTTHRSPSS